MWKFWKRKKNRNDGPSMEAVYAGPEEMRRRWGQKEEPDPEKKDEEPEKPYPFHFSEPTPMNDVYAGPGMFNGEEEEPEEVIEEAAEEPEEEKPYPDAMMSAVYAGPEQMARVYAGPEQMGPVYAGPQMMLVYAGPEQMRGGQWKPAGAPAPAEPDPEQKAREEEEARKDGIPRCPACGAKLTASWTFCPECGTKIDPSPERDAEIGAELAGETEAEQ